MKNDREGAPTPNPARTPGLTSQPRPHQELDMTNDTAISGSLATASVAVNR